MMSSLFVKITFFIKIIILFNSFKYVNSKNTHTFEKFFLGFFVKTKFKNK
jgi:hypothetical protein